MQVRAVDVATVGAAIIAAFVVTANLNAARHVRFGEAHQEQGAMANAKDAVKRILG